MQLCESCGTYHSKDGKFCVKSGANTMSKDGQRYKIVRQHRKIGQSGKEIRVKKHPRKKPRDVVRGAMSRQIMAMEGELSAPGFVSVNDLLGESFKRPMKSSWKKTGGGWPSKDSPTYEADTVVGKAKLFQRVTGRKKEMVLDIDGKEHSLPGRARFEHAECVIADVAKKAGKMKGSDGLTPLSLVVGDLE